jgi:hypothetical protein
MKTGIFGSVKSALLTSFILSFFTGLLVQVVGFDENEIELTQDPALTRNIKVLVIRTKDKSVW